MLIIIVYDKDHKQVDYEEWSLGHPKNTYVRGRHGSNLQVIAHGLELEWIRANITGIRMNRSNQVRWIGEDAVFIANSLPKRENLEGGWL